MNLFIAFRNFPVFCKGSRRIPLFGNIQVLLIIHRGIIYGIYLDFSRIFHDLIKGIHMIVVIMGNDPCGNMIVMCLYNPAYMFCVFFPPSVNQDQASLCLIIYSIKHGLIPGIITVFCDIPLIIFRSQLSGKHISCGKRNDRQKQHSRNKLHSYMLHTVSYDIASIVQYFHSVRSSVNLQSVIMQSSVK